MGGHEALVLALRNPDRFQSVSGFSPISNPVNCSWGQKAFTAYLGKDTGTWTNYDASLLMRKATQFVSALVDQGDADEFFGIGPTPLFVDLDVLAVGEIVPEVDQSD